MTNPAAARARRVVVTGGRGRLGRRVVPELRARGHAVTVLDIAPGTDGDGVVADILDIAALRRVFAGAEAVVHLAGLDMDAPCAPEDFIRVNVPGTWNVLQAAQELRVPKVVLASSVTATGLNEARPDWAPRFLPVDETHELRPRHPYGVSKLLIEDTARAVAEAGITEVIALRPMLVVRPETAARVAASGRDPARRSLCYWVSDADAAAAFGCAVETDGVGFGAFFVTADDSYAAEPTLARAARLWPGAPIEVRDRARYEADPHAGAFDGSRARRVLGFAPARRFPRPDPDPSASSRE
ncbi:MAG: NAD(P)-dependent oxidoreductase [Alphaproteobacteria bacterium]|nr:NAD(P)-dependent oxidoreductase [Alphaproteobacteria bacterium]